MTGTPSGRGFASATPCAYLPRRAGLRRALRGSHMGEPPDWMVAPMGYEGSTRRARLRRGAAPGRGSPSRTAPTSRP